VIWLLRRLAGEDFFSHLTAVQRVLERWDVEEPLSLAGLYHSIYGTEGFQVSCRSLLPAREQL